MAKFCEHCGLKITENTRFCTGCGTPFPDSSVRPATVAPQREVQRPRPRPAETVAVPDGKYAPITTGGYLGIFLLMCIPVVGLLLTILWACGGCKKINKTYLARASLILLVIGLVISLILGISAKIMFDKTVDTIQQETGISITDGELSDGGSLLQKFAAMAGKDDSSGSNSNLDALKELEGLLGILGEDSNDLGALIEGIEGINQQAQADNSGWPKSLRSYPGGTAKFVSSYRTEVYNTSLNEMLGWIDALKSDGFAYEDFYGFGMTEQDMLSVNGWWATNGSIYLSISWDGEKVIVDHTTQLPDLSGILG